jgi:hypothetical protein
VLELIDLFCFASVNKNITDKPTANKLKEKERRRRKKTIDTR